MSTVVAEVAGDGSWLARTVAASPVLVFTFLRAWDTAQHVHYLHTQWSSYRLLKESGKCDPVELNWEHRVNRELRVKHALYDDKVDVVIGNMNPRGDQVYMGTTRQYTMDEWLSLVGLIVPYETQRVKGVTLQFASVRGVELGAPLLRARVAELRRRLPMLWVGADICSFKGHDAQVDADRFIALADAHLDGVPLALGWTYNDKLHDLLAEHRAGANDLQPMFWAAARDMHACCLRVNRARRNRRREITFAAESCLAQCFADQLVWLIEQAPAVCSVTLWHHDDDTPDDAYVAAIVALMQRLPPKRLYYDGPRAVVKQLKHAVHARAHA